LKCHTSIGMSKEKGVHCQSQIDGKMIDGYDDLQMSLVIANDFQWLQVSPIEYGHVLLIPRVLECLPQRIDPDSFLLALHMAGEAGSPYFRLGYNSLGAFATINHLHFQVNYLGIRALTILGGCMRI